MTKHIGSIIKQIASELFGEDNLKNEPYGFLSTNPLALFCKENKQSFQGIKFDGFDFQFCNTTHKIQTDVGVCIASSSKINLLDGKVSFHDNFDVVNAGVKDAEHMIVMSVDKFGYADESNFKVL